MIPELVPAHRGLIVATLGTTMTVAYAASYYIPAVLAVPMAEDLGVSPVSPETLSPLAAVGVAVPPEDNAYSRRVP